MKTLIFFIALYLSCYAVIVLVVDYANFMKGVKKEYDTTFIFLASVFWSVFYHLTS